MLTPETIASRRFDKQVGGYKQDEVEMFLQQVAGEYAKLLSEKEDLEEKIEVLAEKVEQYREDEDSLRSALIGAQKLGDSVIRESKSKAEYILRDYEGYVSVFASDADRRPLQVTGIEVAGLRRADQELLRGGITVGSQEQLLLLLEDLGS